MVFSPEEAWPLMPWLRVESRLPDHQKVHTAGERLGKAGRGRVLAVWLVGSTYAVDHLTDGYVPPGVMEDPRYDRRPADVLAAMIDVGLLHREGDGYRFHDFHDYNPSAEAIKEKRRADLDRKRRGIGSESPRNRSGTAANSEALAGADGRARSESESESEIQKEQKSGSSAPPGAEPPDAFAEFDTVGPIRRWWVTERQIAEWQEAYAAIDVKAEVRKARVWWAANPSKRKTAAGMLRFFANWFRSALNDAQARPRDTRGTVVPGIDETRRKYLQP